MSAASTIFEKLFGMTWALAPPATRQHRAAAEPWSSSGGPAVPTAQDVAVTKPSHLYVAFVSKGTYHCQTIITGWRFNVFARGGSGRRRTPRARVSGRLGSTVLRPVPAWSPASRWGQARTVTDNHGRRSRGSPLSNARGVESSAGRASRSPLVANGVLRPQRQLTMRVQRPSVVPRPSDVPSRLPPGPRNGSNSCPSRLAQRHTELRPTFAPPETT